MNEKPGLEPGFFARQAAGGVTGYAFLAAPALPSPGRAKAVQDMLGCVGNATTGFRTSRLPGTTWV